MENLISEKLNWLLAQPNALTYSLSALKKQYNWERILVKQKSVRRAETWCIASSLCGTSGLELAMRFMEGANCVEAFLHNVSFNGTESNPLILRAINIRLAKLLPAKVNKSAYAILSELGLTYNCGINWATVQCHTAKEWDTLVTEFGKNEIRFRDEDEYRLTVQFHL